MNKKLHSFLFFFLFPLLCFGQRRASADVEVKTMIGNNVTTVTKSVYCSNNGRLVTCFHSPVNYIVETNTLGETKFYFPSKNEVFMDNKGSMRSTDELLSIFVFGRLDDLGLSLSGYKLKTTERLEDGMLKKTFATSRSDMPPVCEVVYNKDYLPIYSATLTADGYATVKVFYSRYEMVQYAPFPRRSTQIVYNSPKDSTIIRTIYSNIKVDGDDKWFDFSIPQDAKPMDMSAMNKR